MKPQLNEFYKRSYNFRVNAAKFRNLEIGVTDTAIEIIDNAINQFENISLSRTKSSRLRDDAKLFLLINFNTMIYRPLRRIEDSESLKHDIFSDIELILKTANDNTLANDQHEISSHEIIKAGLQVWGQLKTMYKGSW